MGVFLVGQTVFVDEQKFTVEQEVDEYALLRTDRVNTLIPELKSRVLSTERIQEQITSSSYTITNQSVRSGGTLHCTNSDD